MTDLGYCRLCAEIKNAATLIVINKNENDSTTNLCDKILQCFQIQILSDDVLPKTLCLDCCAQTNITYEFYLKVQKAQEFLRNIVCNTAVSNRDSDFQYNSIHLVKINELTNKNIFQNNVGTDSQNKSKLGPKIEIAEFPDYDNSPSPIHNENTEVPETNSTLHDENDGNNHIKREECEEADSKMNLSKKLVWNNLIWNCTKCSSEFKTNKELVEHSQIEHGELPKYKCPKCLKNKLYKTYRLFREHVKAHDNQDKYRCDICDKPHGSNSNLKRHLNVFHKQGPQFKETCDICGKEFVNLDGYKEHTKYFHMSAEDKLRFECDICKKRVTSKSSLRQHKKVHDETTKVFTCDQCGVSFRQRDTLRYHLENVHTEISKDNYLSCSMCPTRLKHKIQLRRHIRQVHNPKRFECETCGKKFYLLTKYTVHLRLHTGERPFECRYCDKRFPEKRPLEYHTRQHTGEKPYSCIVCKHDFANLSVYRSHLRRRHEVTSTNSTKILRVNMNITV